MVTACRYVLSPDKSRVVPLAEPRNPGLNKVGMLAWKVTMYTPEFPKGRDIILIANDITFANGTFGPQEDLVHAGEALTCSY